MTDLSHWLTKPEAAARLGISERTLHRLVDEGTGPERQFRPRPGKKPEPVYNPDDIAALAAAVPAVNPPANGALAIRGDGPPPQVASALALIERLAAVVRPQEPRQPFQTLWLTLEAASGYSGLSEAFLRRLVRDGKLPAIRDRALKVRKSDIDNLDNVASRVTIGNIPQTKAVSSRKGAA